MSFVEEHSRALRDVPLRWAATANAVWTRCCEYEGIAPDTKFVVFSPDNPFVIWYERAMLRYWNALAEARAGSYVGLTLENGKAKMPKADKRRKQI